MKLENKGQEIRIERGVRQGDPLSPKLFIAVLEAVFRKIKWNNKGIKILGHYLSHLRFADDIAVFAESATELEQMMQTLDNESRKVGLQMNANKTKVMTNSKTNLIRISGKHIEYVKEYVYLGKQVSFSMRNNEEEVDRRINCTWKKFWSQKEILKGDYHNMFKRIVMDTSILPCLTYGSQTWTLTNKIKQKITTCQRSMERSLLKINKIQKIRSETIRKETRITDGLKQVLRLKWKWAGHITRYKDDRWTLKTTKWPGPAGKRRKGRPYKRWADDIIETAGTDWMQAACNRDKWKAMEEAYTQKGSIPSNT